MISVHPHVCGEHYKSTSFSAISSGSSPRVWGTLSFQMPINYLRRFIPTCVGNMGPCVFLRPGCAVHPHVCGEHQTPREITFQRHGSSPRVWGTSTPYTQISASYRFIPTCVGNILVAFCWVTSLAVHPHVCGEHWEWTQDKYTAIGSSPRVWGTCLIAMRRTLGTRFIPTCVGNIALVISLFILTAVHPHVCGEHPFGTRQTGNVCGSSPRVWGTCNWASSRRGMSRFIPTCVGNIGLSFLSIGVCAVHPHVCGEHIFCIPLLSYSTGSSPRVWGTSLSARQE